MKTSHELAATIAHIKENTEEETPHPHSRERRWWWVFPAAVALNVVATVLLSATGDYRGAFCSLVLAIMVIAVEAECALNWQIRMCLRATEQLLVRSLELHLDNVRTIEKAQDDQLQDELAAAAAPAKE